MRLPLLAAFAAWGFLPAALADIKFITPAAGSTLPGGGALSVTWDESGDSPAISTLTSYQLFLCAGGNTAAEYIQLETIVTNGVFANGNKAGGSIPPGVGASTPANAYFLMMISTGPSGSVTNFSPRFSISGMTGSFPPNVLTGLNTVLDTAGPARINAVGNAAAGTAPAAAGVFSVLYGMQTGATKYASMQPKPGTKITQKNTKPMNPTSAASIATAFLPPAAPSVVTTVTQSVTWSVSQRENTVAAASQPTDDMQKFLARWKD